MSQHGAVIREQTSMRIPTEIKIALAKEAKKRKVKKNVIVLEALCKELGLVWVKESFTKREVEP